MIEIIDIFAVIVIIDVIKVVKIDIYVDFDIQKTCCWELRGWFV
jgi:hypothetical protein